MGVFRLVGSFTWNEEAAGSSPVSHTSWPVRLMVEDFTFSLWRYEFESRTGYKWFVGVKANITDCRSVAMGSIPVRTANNVELCNGSAYQSLTLMVLVLPIAIGTNSTTNVGSSLSVKHPSVQRRNRVRIPVLTYSLMDKNTSLRMKRWEFESF